MQQLQAELDESWERSHEAAGEETVRQLRTLLSGMKRTDEDQKEMITYLQDQLSRQSKHRIPSRIRENVSKTVNLSAMYHRIAY